MGCVGQCQRNPLLGPQDEVLEGGVLRVYQPRAATAIPSKICPTDSWNVPAVGSRNIVTGGRRVPPRKVAYEEASMGPASGESLWGPTQNLDAGHYLR